MQKDVRTAKRTERTRSTLLLRNRVILHQQQALQGVVSRHFRPLHFGDPNPRCALRSVTYRSPFPLSDHAQARRESTVLIRYCGCWEWQVSP